MLILLIAVLASVLWGTMPAVATPAVGPDHPLLIAAVRSLGGGLALLLLFRQLPPRDWYGRVLTLGTVNIGLVFSLFFVSAARLPGGIIAILMALSPFWTALIAWPLLGERPRVARLLLIALGVSGVALLVKASAFRLDAIGILAGVVAAASMGGGVVLIKKWGRPASLYRDRAPWCAAHRNAAVVGSCRRLADRRDAARKTIDRLAGCGRAARVRLSHTRLHDHAHPCETGAIGR